MTKLVTEKQQNQAVEALKRMVSHPSYSQDKTLNAPFGKPIRDALDEILSICDELGFTTTLIRGLLRLCRSRFWR